MRGIYDVFALTLQPEFFAAIGYERVDRARYPEKIRRDCLAARGASRATRSASRRISWRSRGRPRRPSASSDVDCATGALARPNRLGPATAAPFAPSMPISRCRSCSPLRSRCWLPASPSRQRRLLRERRQRPPAWWCSSRSIRCAPTTSTAGRRSSPAGLARLSQQGAFFTNAYQDHAITETAPGHSVTMSGRFPRSTGIVRNAAGVEDPQAPLLTSRDPAASPYRFRGSVLIDWMREHAIRARARCPISRKDRGAILPLGRAKQNVFWYATSNGEFTTSRYYADTLPDWIRRVNARRVPQQLAGQAWTLLLAAARVPRAGQRAAGERRARLHLSARVADRRRARGVASCRRRRGWTSSRSTRRSKGCRRSTSGAARRPTCSRSRSRPPTTSAIATGPTRASSTTTSCASTAPSARSSTRCTSCATRRTIVFALTADHGVTPFPELVAQRADRTAAAVRYDLAPVACATLRGMLQGAGVDTRRGHARRRRSCIVRPRPHSRARASIAEPLLAPLRRRAARSARASRASTACATSRSADTVHDAVARRWLHMLPPDSPVEYVVTPVEGAYPAGATIAEHGSPYDDDAHVPVIFYGAVVSGRAAIAERALVVDARADARARHRRAADRAARRARAPARARRRRRGDAR